jgi:hypothetical protein
MQEPLFVLRATGNVFLGRDTLELMCEVAWFSPFDRVSAHFFMSQVEYMGYLVVERLNA